MAESLVLPLLGVRAMIFRSAAEYFADRAASCRAAAAWAPDIANALANEELAKRYDAYSQQALMQQTEALPPKPR